MTKKDKKSEILAEFDKIRTELPNKKTRDWFSQALDRYLESKMCQCTCATRPHTEECYLKHCPHQSIKELK